MKNIEEERRENPVTTLMTGHQITVGMKAAIWTGIVLTCCAVALFIWLITRFAAEKNAGGIVMMSSFILFAFGVFYYLLARINNGNRAWAVLYITVPIAVAAFVVSLFV